MLLQEPHKILLKGIADLQESADYSDLTITCGTDIYKVHKAIVCTQSEFFRLACRTRSNPDGDFLEAQTGVIDIPARNTSDDQQEVDWDAEAEDPEIVKLMIYYFYHLDYVESSSFMCVSGMAADWLLVINAKLYAMGDKYGIPGLKSLARDKFEHILKDEPLSINACAKAIKIAYASTLESDKGLRDTIIDFINPDIQTWVNIPEVDACIREIPDLSYALLRKNI